MALFNKKNKVQKEVVKASNEAISSIISKEMQITGEVRFKGKARIDGTIEGNVTGEYLVLSESGRIHGDLLVDALICHGKVEGKVKAKLVTAHSTAQIHGKLMAKNLTVESGATLDGEIRAASQQQTVTQQALPLSTEKKETKG